MPRPIEELLNTPEPAWPMVQDWIKSSRRPVEILPTDERRAREVLLAAQVTIRSPLGAIILNSAGILIDHGWLRFLGSGGHPRMRRSVMEWNEPPRGLKPGMFLIADDVVGGFFALDGGAFGPGKADVFYLAPDSLEWEPLDRGYSAFLNWALTGDLDLYYKNLRWPGWEEEVGRIDGDQALSLYPFPWTKEGKDLAKVSRRAVPVAEVYGLSAIEWARQLGLRTPYDETK